MGLQRYLHGVTFECPPIALQEKRKIVRCMLEEKKYSSSEIDRIFSASKTQGKSLYYVDEPLLHEVSPDIIFTQDVCEVCQIDTACTSAAVAKLEKTPDLISISPNNLDDVFQTAITIATALGHEEAAYSYLAGLRSKLDEILDRLRLHKAPLKRVMIMEWMEPVYNCGHWIPFQVAYAGGVDMLSNPGGNSMVVPWDKIVKYDPEVLVIAPCGFDIERTLEELSLLAQKAEWKYLQAVQTQQVYVADYDLFTQPSAGTLVNGIVLLAALFHKEIFTIPAALRHKYLSIKKIMPKIRLTDET